MRPSSALARHCDQVADILSRYQEDDAQVFGSTARGEDTSASDLDIVISGPASRSFRKLASLEKELEDVLPVKISLHTIGEFSPSFLDKVRGDMRPVRSFGR